MWSILKFTFLLEVLCISVFKYTFAFAPGFANTKAMSTSQINLKDENMTPEEREEAVEKATKAMTAFSNTYLKLTNTKYCSDLSIPAVVIKGLAEHKVSLGAPLCPCRYYEDKEKEAKDGFWNCPCVPMRERHECHCMLFLTEDNDFVGDETKMSYDEVVDLSGGMSMGA
jgi:ferredoxin-thioredoxin reductase catalytic chain